MARTDGRPHLHIQEKKPSSAESPAPPRPTSEERAAAQEGLQPTWRWTATLWAIVFLFLSALLLFDMVVGLVHG